MIKRRASDGKVVKVDVLKLLCLTEPVDYGLDVITQDARAARNIASGETITFCPVDQVVWSPPVNANMAKVRLLSDRQRASPGALGPGLSLPGRYTVYAAAHLPEFDANYMGHKIPCSGIGNCKHQPRDTSVPIVATSDISVGEPIYITQTAVSSS